MANQTGTRGTHADVRTLWGFNGDTLDYAERAYRSWLQGAESVQANAMNYWSNELQKGIEAMNQMAKCETAAEAFGVQTRFATEAMQDFFAESQKVIDQLASFGTSPWAVTALGASGEKHEEASHKRSTPHRRS
jgi:hypothetical protein